MAASHVHAAPAAIGRARAAGAACAPVFVWAVFLGLAARFALVVWRHSANIIFWDQWDFYTPLFESSPLWKLFLRQHGPHREGLGLVLDSFVLGWSHWNNRAEAMFMVACLIAAAGLALELKRRLTGALDYVDVAIPLLFFTLQQLESLLGASNPSYSAVPELLIVLYCLAWLVRRAWLKYGLVLLLNFALIYTGFGFFMGPVTLGLLALDVVHRLRARRALGASVSSVHKLLPESTRGLTLPLFSLGIAGLSFASFFIGYVWSPAADCYVFPYPQKIAYGKFLSLMLAYFAGVEKIRLAFVVGTVIGAAILLVLLVHLAALWRNREWRALDIIVVALASFTCLFCANAAVGRVCLGVGAAQASRYMGLLVPGFLAIYLHLRASGHRRAHLAAVLLVLMLAPACVRKPGSTPYSAYIKNSWKQCYLKTSDIDYCDRTSPWPIYPRPAATHLKDKLEFLRRNRLNLYADSH